MLILMIACGGQQPYSTGRLPVEEQEQTVELRPVPRFPDPVELSSVTYDHSAGCRRDPPPRFDIEVEKAADWAGIDPRLLSVTVWRESECDPQAIGAHGEIGLTQINPKVWSDYLADHGIPGSLWDVQNNLRAGALVLRYCQDRHESLQQVFRCYNGSGAAAEAYGREQAEVYYSVWK